jgi:hypothetical protein
MDEELFYPISRDEYLYLKTNRHDVMKFANNPVERKSLTGLKKVIFVVGIDDTPKHIGYIDIWDIWESDQGLFLRHYSHDSTD